MKAAEAKMLASSLGNFKGYGSWVHMLLEHARELEAEENGLALLAKHVAAKLPPEAAMRHLAGEALQEILKGYELVPVERAELRDLKGAKAA